MGARTGWLIWFVLFIWLIDFIWLVSFNQKNQIDQTNKITGFFCCRLFQHPARAVRLTSQ
jgi:hypothetical protein